MALNLEENKYHTGAQFFDGLSHSSVKKLRSGI